MLVPLPFGWRLSKDAPSGKRILHSLNVSAIGDNGQHQTFCKEKLISLYSTDQPLAFLGSQCADHHVKLRTLGCVVWQVIYYISIVWEAPRILADDRLASPGRYASTCPQLVKWPILLVLSLINLRRDIFPELYSCHLASSPHTLATTAPTQFGGTSESSRWAQTTPTTRRYVPSSHCHRFTQGVPGSA